LYKIMNTLSLKKGFFSVILVMITGFCFGQYEKQNIQFCPLSLFDEFTFPAVQGGYERSLSQRFSIYNEIGIRYRRGFFDKADTIFIKNFGFRLKSEVRYYFPRAFGLEGVKTVLNGLYVAANIFYVMNNHNSEISYHPSGNNTLLAYDDFIVRRNETGINLLFGLQKKLPNHFLIDIYAGGGYRMRIINNSNLKYNSGIDILKKPSGFDINGFRNAIELKTGTSFSPSLTLGLRLGRRF
jgi:hypothetical protein